MVWETQPELFLHVPYYSGGTIYTKRCLDMTNTVPLTGNDFDDEFLIPPNDYKKHLVKSRWSQSHFKRFIDYISPNHFLVNCQGLVFLEVFPFDHKEDIAASKPIYVRLFDVIDLTKYGFSKRPKKVPPRTIKYLVDGFDAKVEDPPVVTDSSDDDDDDDDDEEDFGDRPRFDPSWMTYHRDWFSAQQIWDNVSSWPAASTYPSRPPALEITRQGTNFSDDNTTNVRRDLFYGVKYPAGHLHPVNIVISDSELSAQGRFERYFFPVKIVLLDSEMGAQGRFDPRVWGVFNSGYGSFFVGRMLENDTSSNDLITYTPSWLQVSML